MLYVRFSIFFIAALIYEEALQRLAYLTRRHLIAEVYLVKCVTLASVEELDSQLLPFPELSFRLVQKVLRKYVLQTLHLVDVLLVADDVVLEAQLNILISICQRAHHGCAQIIAVRRLTPLLIDEAFELDSAADFLSAIH